MSCHLMSLLWLYLEFAFNDGFVVDFGEEALTTSSYMRKTLKKAAWRHTLVSPMLPNWPKPFIKFAGVRAEFNLSYNKGTMGWNLKEPIFNELHILLEAFVHYTWVWSEQTLIFTNLQGEFRYKAIWTTGAAEIDVSSFQVHGCATNRSSFSLTPNVIYEYVLL